MLDIHLRLHNTIIFCSQVEEGFRSLFDGSFDDFIKVNLKNLLGKLIQRLFIKYFITLFNNTLKTIKSKFMGHFSALIKAVTYYLQLLLPFRIIKSMTLSIDIIKRCLFSFFDEEESCRKNHG